MPAAWTLACYACGCLFKTAALIAAPVGVALALIAPDAPRGAGFVMMSLCVWVLAQFACLGALACHRARARWTLR